MTKAAYLFLEEPNSSEKDIFRNTNNACMFGGVQQQTDMGSPISRNITEEALTENSLTPAESKVG